MIHNLGRPSTSSKVLPEVRRMLLTPSKRTHDYVRHGTTNLFVAGHRHR
jgi:hypothetical protein